VAEGEFAKDEAGRSSDQTPRMDSEPFALRFQKRAGGPGGRRPPHARDISRAVNNFDRNPTRVLFGASNNAQQAPAPPPAAANEKKRQ
jgi:hypothetical protein